MVSEHEIALRAVYVTRFVEVRGKIVLGHVLVADILEQHVGVYIGGLLGDGERHGERFVEHQETQSERRSHHLGKAACIQHASLRCPST